MDHGTDERIRALAQPLWESAARPYGMALDFWLMAEQMVLEMMSAVARLQKAAVSEPVPPDLPTWTGQAMPVHQVQRLAECMWESAGRQWGMAQDFWLAAERHILAIVRAAAAAKKTPEFDKLVSELAALPPEAYLDRVRVMAYFLWEAAGQNYGNALDYWLAAERNLLTLLASGAEPSSPSGVDG